MIDRTPTARLHFDRVEMLKPIIVAAALVVLSACSIDIGNPGDSAPFADAGADASVFEDIGAGIDTSEPDAAEDVAIDLGFPDVSDASSSDTTEDTALDVEADANTDVAVDADMDTEPIDATDGVSDGSGEADADLDAEPDTTLDADLDAELDADLDAEVDAEQDGSGDSDVEADADSGEADAGDR